MTEAPKQKEHEVDPTAWGQYFKNEFEMLKLRRGILQAEKLTKDELRILTGEMIQECEKPPYKQIDKVVIQRVISDGVINDPDFIGFTVSWVRRTLNKWWHLYGFKILEKIQREKEIEKSREYTRLLTLPDWFYVRPVKKKKKHLNVDFMLESFRQSLLKPADSKSGMRKVPDVTDEEKQRLGKDRIEQKAATAGYEPDYKRRIQILIEHTMRELARDGYSYLKPVEKIHFQVYKVEISETEVYKVECECQEDAELLYEKAKEILDKQLKSKKLKGD